MDMCEKGAASTRQSSDESHRAGDKTHLCSPVLPLYKPCWLHEGNQHSSSFGLQPFSGGDTMVAHPVPKPSTLIWAV